MTKSEFKEARSALRVPNLWKKNEKPIRLAMQVLSLAAEEGAASDGEREILLDARLMLERLRVRFCL